MHIAGIIAEYNPLHKGHKFHIEKTKSITGADYVVTVLSGDFVQRGLPALMDKHTRTRMALEAGSDLVIELPAYYALSSGEGFAFGGISILDQLGCVDTVSFGTEAGDLSSLTTIAKLLSNESIAYKEVYQSALKNGMTHPAARLVALKEVYPEIDTSILADASNNMLALEYCKALYRLDSSITPVTIKREGQAYLAKNEVESNATNLATTNMGDLSATNFENFTSATAIRNALEKDPDSRQRFVFLDDFSSILHYKLLALDLNSLLTYREVNDTFANKILKNRNNFLSFTQFANLLWTKETTYAKVCRTLMYILLDFKKDDWDVHTPVPYARVLGFRKDAAPLLAEIKKTSAIPLVTKLADAESLLSKDAMALLQADINAAHIYDSVCLHKTTHSMAKASKEAPVKNEMQKQIVII